MTQQDICLSVERIEASRWFKGTFSYFLSIRQIENPSSRNCPNTTETQIWQCEDYNEVCLVGIMGHYTRLWYIKSSITVWSYCVWYKKFDSYFGTLYENGPKPRKRWESELQTVNVKILTTGNIAKVEFWQNVFPEPPNDIEFCL